MNRPIDEELPAYKFMREIQSAVGARFVETDFGAKLVKTIDGVDYEVTVQPELKDTRPVTYPRGQSLNPVTFRTEIPAEPDVSVSRLHVGTPGRLNKLVSMVLHRGEGTQILTHTNLDEDQFIDGLRLLFPNGELSGGTERVAQLLLQWWEGFDDGDMEDNALVKELEPVVALAQQVLAKT